MMLNHRPWRRWPWCGWRISSWQAARRTSNRRFRHGPFAPRAVKDLFAFGNGDHALIRDDQFGAWWAQQRQPPQQDDPSASRARPALCGIGDTPAKRGEFNRIALKRFISLVNAHHGFSAFHRPLLVAGMIAQNHAARLNAIEKRNYLRTYAIIKQIQIECRAASLPPPACHNRNGGPAVQQDSTLARGCVTCGAPLVRGEKEQPSRFQKRITCNRSCGSLHSWKTKSRTSNPLARIPLEQKTCPGCGEYFQPSHRRRKFCSHACRAQSLSPLHRDRVLLICAHCTKRFEVHRGDLVSAFGYVKRFCSKSCASNARRGEGYHFVCPECNSPFFDQKQPDRQYCSHACHLKARNRENGNGPTSIERDVWDALALLEIRFIPQHRLGKFVVDAFLPELRIVLECQGDYYHCNPRLYPAGPINKTQSHSMDRDARRFSAFRAAGYRVVEVWELDIKTRGARVMIEELILGRVAPSTS